MGLFALVTSVGRACYTVSKLFERRFAKIRNGKIVNCPATKKNEPEDVQKLIWRYFVVRSSCHRHRSKLY